MHEKDIPDFTPSETENDSLEEEHSLSEQTPEAKEVRITRIRTLNDFFRQTFIGGRVKLNPGILAMKREAREAIKTKVRAFKDFNEDNDPWGEHDFGVVEHGGERIFWKIDYYDKESFRKGLDYGSEDPSDPKTTLRFLTIYLASEH